MDGYEEHAASGVPLGRAGGNARAAIERAAAGTPVRYDMGNGVRVILERELGGVEPAAAPEPAEPEAEGGGADPQPPE